MTARVAAFTLMALAPVAVFAAEAPAPAAPTATEAAPSAAPAPAADVGPPGDVVTLKSGRTYRGFQVINSTSAEVELEVTPEVKLKIPRRQIVSIEYDEIDPVIEAQKRKDAQAAMEKAASALLSGQKVSPEIQAKLAADISAPPFSFDKRILGEIITELNKRPQIGAIFEIDNSVKSLPEDQRRWSVKSVPGMTLAGLLEELKKSLPHLATIIRDNKLVITNQETARALLGGEQPAPPAPPAPAASAPGAPAPAAPTPAVPPAAAPAPK